MTRKPRRINATVSHQLFNQLQALADIQGRSLSSLCAYLLETSIEQRRAAQQQAAQR